MANREDVILSAVKFLKDPKVQSSALAKKVAFLESKGLTSAEIEEALSRVSGAGPAVPGAPPVPAGAVPAGSYAGPAVQYTIAPPPVKSLDWKDYFIAAVVTGGVGYGVYSLARKYINSTFSGPSQAELEAEKKKIDQQFQEASETLNIVKKDTEDVLKHVEAQTTEVKTSLESMAEILNQLKGQDTDRDVELKTLREELEKVKNTIPEVSKLYFSP
ncbi:peroxisomal membrane protein pex14 [Basidiobolus ranarum]|uniref:Peroxisomal membrane protein PEX14 n=1 Tax=Basidiobolus ranarum TaxID=34480 RepID=A0ABR2X469_9FUNG